VLVLEHAVQDEEFLPAAVRMRSEMAVRRIADDRGGTSHFVADAIQHPAVYAGDGRRRPRQPCRMHDCPLGKIGVDLHRDDGLPLPRF
jgi:hypothetical protein